MAYLPGQQYVQNGAGAWVPLGYASGGAAMPVVSTSPNGLAAGLFATVSAYGYQRVTTEPGLVFSDPFDGNVFDTTNRWNAPVGTATQTSGMLAIGNTTISTQHYVTTQPTFPPVGLNFLIGAWVAQLETSPLTTNVARFMGFGVHTGTPSAAVPITDGAGFELPGDGTMRAVVYQNGVRAASSATINASAVPGPTRYAVLLRADLAIFYVGSTEVPVANISFVTPNNTSLPLRFQQVNSGTVTGTPTFSIGAAAVHDTGHNTLQIADGALPYRKAQVTSTGLLNVNIAGSAGATTAVSGAITAIGTQSGLTSTTGKVIANVSTSGNATVSLNAAAFVGTLAFEGSDDGVNFYPLAMTREDGLGTDLTVAVNGALARLYIVGLPGIMYMQIRATAFTSGSLTARITAGPMLIEPLPSLGGGSAMIGRVAPVLSTTGGFFSSFTPATSVQNILGPSTTRVGYKVFNDSNVDVLVNEGASNGATATVYSYRVLSGGFYESGTFVWGGNISMVGVVGSTLTTATTGALRVTEMS